MNRFAAAGLAVLFLVVAAMPAYAKPTKRFDRGSAGIRELTFSDLRDGYKIFRQNCKSCHHRGNDQGAKFLHTESKTMRAWNRVFYQRYPQCASAGAWQSLSREDLLKLNDYLFINAADAVDVSCFL